MIRQQQRQRIGDAIRIEYSNLELDWFKGYCDAD
jgi:hypothetical protein